MGRRGAGALHRRRPGRHLPRHGRHAGHRPDHAGPGLARRRGPTGSRRSSSPTPTRTTSARSGCSGTGCGRRSTPGASPPRSPGRRWSAPGSRPDAVRARSTPWPHDGPGRAVHGRLRADQPLDPRELGPGHRHAGGADRPHRRLQDRPDAGGRRALRPRGLSRDDRRRAASGRWSAIRPTSSRTIPAGRRRR